MSRPLALIAASQMPNFLPQAPVNAKLLILKHLQSYPQLPQGEEKTKRNPRGWISIQVVGESCWTAVRHGRVGVHEH